MARVALLVGGPGDAHDESISTGAEVLRCLREAAHVVRPVWISADGLWAFGASDDLLEGVLGRHDGLVATSGAVASLRASGETAYLALHGTFGIDGALQRRFEEAGVSYTGSGPVASETCLDKDLATLAVVRLGGRCAKHEIVAGTRFPAWGIGKGIGYPCVVKPVRSSPGTDAEIVGSEEGLRDAVTRAQIADPEGRCMVEEFIAGHDVSCCVLNQRDGVKILPPVERARDDGTCLRPAAGLRSEIGEEIARISHALFEGLGLRGLARIDFVVPSDGGRPVFLEVMTSPALPPHGLVATAARAADISSAEIVAAVLSDASPALPTRGRR